jgi:UDP-glucose 4-epimerase
MVGCAAVVHLAAVGSVTGSVDDPAANFEANVVGTFLVLDAARRAGVARVVQASTGGALIGNATPAGRRTVAAPAGLAARGVQAGRRGVRARAFAATYGLRTVAVRFGNVYGPWCTRKRGVFNVFFTALRSGAPLVIYGDGSASRDYVYVTDIARALRLALEKPDLPGGTVLHAASGVETAIGTPADFCRRAARLPSGCVRTGAAGRGGAGRNFASYDLAR